MTVEGYHTYFVGDPTWGFSCWAHNDAAYDELVAEAKALEGQAAALPATGKAEDAVQATQALQKAQQLRTQAQRIFQGLSPTMTLEAALKGTGNIAALGTNPNLKGLDVKKLMKMKLEDIKTQITKKQWDTLKKHFNRTASDIRHDN